MECASHRRPYLPRNLAEKRLVLVNQAEPGRLACGGAFAPSLFAAYTELACNEVPDTSGEPDSCVSECLQIGEEEEVAIEPCHG